MESHFLAIVSRMKYIERWALMRNSRPENLSEHAMDVAMIAHTLCVIGNVRYGKQLDAEKAALIALYHDASEIITGDMPTPVKYANGVIRDAYKKVEADAVDRLLAQLPEDLRPVYAGILHEPADGGEQAGQTEEDAAERELRALVKAADKLSALIKCTEEEAAGNTEFRTAALSTRKKLDEIAAKSPEVRDFMRNFLPSYGKTLDELL
ncbi:MAG: 5'-deoxynucleotidase [Eubacterium sp.]|nr:5'-deoxynucleotidase [Eubacterium sp.]